MPIADPPVIASGRVVGQFVVGVVDGDDPDDEPDLIGARGSFEFTPTVAFIINPLGVPNPFTLLREPIIGILDAEGHLCTPDPTNPSVAGKRGLRLFSTETASGSSQIWQWKATPKFENQFGIRIAEVIAPFTFDLPANTTVDLTRVVGAPTAVP